MFIPIRTDYRLTRRPLVNYILLAVNIGLFLMRYNGDHPERIDAWLLHPDTPRVYQFVSSVFLHADWMHLIGNMVFLWVFGNAINDRFGNVGYLAFYLAGGVLACVGYLVLGGTAPVLGASGAISAVTGAYLVLFPRARVTLLFWFYLIMTFEVSSLFFLLFQLLHNIYESFSGTLAGGGGVAYNAHISGYVFGIATAVGLLAGRILPRDVFDLLNLIRTARRKKRFRRMVAGGYDPFMSGDPGDRLRREAAKRRVPSRSVSAVTPDNELARDLDLRREIAESCLGHDLHSAARKYVELIGLNGEAVLARQNQLDVANHLMASKHHAEAAEAYERFLKHYGTYEHVADICLMLGLIYGRYLSEYDRAEPLLERAREALSDPRKQELARTELENVRRRRGA